MKHFATLMRSSTQRRDYATQTKGVGRPAFWLATAMALGATLPASANAASLEETPSQIGALLDPSDLMTLAGNVHPSARVLFDQGLVSAQHPLNHLFITLQRSAAQASALEAFNSRQYDVNSPDYHRWLQPAEFGATFGPTDSDLATVTRWLKDSGFTLLKVSAGRISIEFSGTAAQVQNAFHVQMHRYLVDGTLQVANDRDPQVPRALTPLISGIGGLNTFPMHSDTRGESTATPLAARNIDVNPKFTVADGVRQFEFVTPYDFATIYNSLPLWKASKPIVGTGVSIAVIGDNDINLNDIKTFRSSFGLSANVPSVIHVSGDPKGSSEQSTVSLEMAGAAAPGATLTLVVSGGGKSLGSLFSAASYAVDNNIAAIVSFGYSECEKTLGTANNTLINSIWEQGATQGMSIFVAAGGQGSAGCSIGGVGSADTLGLQVNGIASSPFVTAVGGTDFEWGWLPFTQSEFWNTSGSTGGNSTQLSSAKGYIPEMPWNVSCANDFLRQQFFVNGKDEPTWPTTVDLCNALENNSNWYTLLTVSGGGGGYSHCTTLDSSGACVASSGYAKPTWQTGTGVPADGKRDIPDVSLFGSKGFPSVPNFSPPTSLVPGSLIMTCYTGGATSHPCKYDNYDDSIYQGNGGTNASAAYFAGILALVEQKEGGARQGLVNHTLYKLWSKEDLSGCNTESVKTGNSCLFYDISRALGNAQPCVAGSTSDCSSSGLLDGILKGYIAGAGYDQATGLGSVNITNLVQGWQSTAPSPTVSLSVTSITYGSVTVGTTSSANMITVKNTGSVAVTINAGGVALSGQADDFTISNACKATLAIGASCSITVEFKPVSAGTKAATVSISDSAGGSPQKVSLTGTGVTSSNSAAITLSAPSLAFGKEAAGTVSAAKSVTLTNSGAAVLTFKTITLTGQADDFGVKNGCGMSLAAGKTCTLSIQFKPVSTGNKSSGLSIAGNFSNSPVAVPLTGTGT